MNMTRQVIAQDVHDRMKTQTENEVGNSGRLEKDSTSRSHKNLGEKSTAIERGRGERPDVRHDDGLREVGVLPLRLGEDAHEAHGGPHGCQQPVQVQLRTRGDSAERQ